MTSGLQDKLSSLREQACTSHAEAAKLANTAAERTVETVLALGKARALCDDATWYAFLRDAEISDDAAGDLLELYRLTLNARALVDLGGVKAARAWATDLRLPVEGEVLAVTAGPWSSANPDPISYIWPFEGGHCVGIVNFYDPNFEGKMTRGPADRERVIWQCVWNLLGPRHAQMTFHLIAGDEAKVLKEHLELRRLNAFGNSGGLRQ